jgi:diguanylate cyclase (GGDEF)-like protein
MNAMTRTLLVTIALLFATMRAQAVILPPGTYPFRTYGVESGLENLSTTRIAQDTAGFLWVATQDGIYRYDGNRFRRYGLDEGLPSTYVPTLMAGPRGALWALTGAGVVRWDGRRFHVVESLPRTAANAISIDRAGRVWVAMQEGLFASDSGGTFARVGGWTGSASAVWCDARNGAVGEVWIASTGVIARLANNTWSRFDVTPRERIDSVVIDARRRVWARSGNHLWSLALDGSDLRDESAALPATSNNGYLSLDAGGNLWVPTDRGLAIRDAKEWRVIGSAQGLPTDWARDAFEDREGSIWIASLGVHRMLGRGEVVSYKRENGLPSEVTWCFHWDREGHLLVGTDLGLARSTATGWTVVYGTEQTQIRTLVEEEDGTLWAGGSPPEVIRIDARGVRRYGEADGIAGRTIMRIVRDRQGAIWVASRGGGLLRKAPDEERFVRAGIPNGTADEEFRDVHEDRAGHIWATGQHGLARYAGGRWTRFTTKDGLKHDHVSYIAEMPSGDLWVPYFEPLGMAHIRPAPDSDSTDGIRVLGHAGAASGLSFNKIFIVGNDRRGRLWVGGGSGVDVVSRGGIEHLSTVDGLAGDDTDAMAFLADANGNVFIGTSSGFSHYVERPDPPRRVPPVVALTSATLGTADVPLTGGLSFPSSAQKRDFAATFSALSFFKPDIVEYDVRLAGLDPAWQRVKEPRAHWSRLPPGDYRFEVRARLRPGAWSEPAALTFEIRPAWWQTNLANAAALALLALLAWLAYRARVSLLRRRNAELQELVEQRTRELAEISVTDALTGMKNRRYLQFCMPEYTAEALRRGDLICLLIDLDRFKDVNDLHGHLVGDEILISLHELFRTLLRESDTLVRWGGEELLYLAHGAERDDAWRIAERIRAAVEEHEFHVGTAAPLRLTCSIGFAAYPFLEDDPRRVSWQEVVDIADICLYAAKRAGRNCWLGARAHHSPAPETLVRRMRESLDDVIAAGEVEVVSSHDVDGEDAVIRKVR